jgi:deoxyadenosine/deoxycytidine kinase
MGKINRIAITGASGVGKTTLAKYISEKYNIPFISSSASELWPIYGFNSHKEALLKCLADPVLGFRYQENILSNRHIVLQKAPMFITDRSPIDNYAYFLLQQGYLSNCDNDYFRDLCKIDYDLLDAVIHIKYSPDMGIEDNKKRIVNNTYQMMVDKVIEMVLKESLLEPGRYKPYITIKTHNLETRKAAVDLLFQ